MVEWKREVSTLSLVVVIICTLLQFDIARANSTLLVAPDSQVTYSRALFKHWIDEDKDGCDTRAEVLIEEATVKPKIGKKCALTGGSWLSPYDNKVQSKASSLDIDHLVPLAEAWRSGAWKWTAAQRQVFANDLGNKEALVAVTLSLNRSKGDKDVASWLPLVNRCTYARDWIVVKLTYSLTVDSAEASKLNELIQSCKITGVTIGTNSNTPTSNSEFKMPLITEFKLGILLSKWSTYGFNKQPLIVQEQPTLKDYSCKPVSNDDTIKDIQPKWNTVVDADTQVTVTVYCTYDFDSKKTTLSPTPTSSPSTSTSPSPSSTPIQTPSPSPKPTTSPTPNPTPTPTPTVSVVATPTPTPTSTLRTISPGAFCSQSESGQQGQNSKGVIYTCKVSDTENRLRWRQ